MARKRKSRSKDRTLIKKAVRGIANARQTSKTHSRGKEAGSRKRKAVSETPRRINRLKKMKKVKSSSSIQLIRVQPCCSSEKERKKYAKLGLDSALFFSSSKPAKRKQSHISVITISSSDDEYDEANDKTTETADWVSKMDLGTINISHTEEPFPSGDADYSQDDRIIEDILEAEKCRPQKSSLQICSSPEPTFKPLFASTPQDQPSIFQPPCFSTPVTEVDNQLTYKGPSFLENPAVNIQQLTRKVSKSPHIIASTNQTHRDDESKVKSILTSRSSTPKFYFGPLQNVQEQKVLENNELPVPMWSDWSFSTQKTSNAIILDKELGRQDSESRMYSLEQVPSTSNAPVSDPILEVNTKKKKSNSGNSSTSK